MISKLQICFMWSDTLRHTILFMSPCLFSAGLLHFYSVFQPSKYPQVSSTMAGWKWTIEISDFPSYKPSFTSGIFQPCLMKPEGKSPFFKGKLTISMGSLHLWRFFTAWVSGHKISMMHTAPQPKAYPMTLGPPSHRHFQIGGCQEPRKS